MERWLEQRKVQLRCFARVLLEGRDGELDHGLVDGFAVRVSEVQRQRLCRAAFRGKEPEVYKHGNAVQCGRQGGEVDVLKQSQQIDTTVRMAL